MTTEVESLRDEFVRRGVAAHAHLSPELSPCPDGEVCLTEEDQATALVVGPDSHKVHVDPITALLVLEGLPEDAGSDQLWAELDSIDHGA